MNDMDIKKFPWWRKVLLGAALLMSFGGLAGKIYLGIIKKPSIPNTPMEFRLEAKDGSTALLTPRDFIAVELSKTINPENTDEWKHLLVATPSESALQTIAAQRVIVYESDRLDEVRGVKAEFEKQMAAKPSVAE